MGKDESLKMDEELFDRMMQYSQLNDKPHNTRRAKFLGIEAKDVLVAPGADIRIPPDQIGENCFIGLYSYLNGNVTIGKNVLIGPHCSIVAGNHKYDPATDWFSARTEQDGDDSVVIGEGSWLASNVTVTPGVKLGRVNLVCAGSVVTKSTADYAIMAGIPAKQIGRIDRESGRYIWFSHEKKESAEGDAK